MQGEGLNDLIVFPQAIPVMLGSDLYYRPAIESSCSTACIPGNACNRCRYVLALLRGMSSNAARLTMTRLRSVAAPEEVPDRLIKIATASPDGSSWVVVSESKDGILDDDYPIQEIWAHRVPIELVDQLRIAYEENLEITNVAIGQDCWFLQAKRPGAGAHIFWGGKVPYSEGFVGAMKAAISIDTVIFSQDGWLVSFDSGSWVWRGIMPEVAAQIEKSLIDGNQPEVLIAGRRWAVKSAENVCGSEIYFPSFLFPDGQVMSACGLNDTVIALLGA